MTFQIKYEDTSGDCHIETIPGYHPAFIVQKTKYPCKEVYWIKAVITKTVTVINGQR